MPIAGHETVGVLLNVSRVQTLERGRSGYAYVMVDGRSALHLTWWRQGDVLEYVGHLVASEEGIERKC